MAEKQTERSSVYGRILEAGSLLELGLTGRFDAETGLKHTVEILRSQYPDD